MLAFLNMDSWHIGKHRRGNTAAVLRRREGKKEESEQTFCLLPEHKLVITLTLPQADLGRLVFSFPLLSSSNSSARPHVLHKQRTSHLKKKSATECRSGAVTNKKN